MNKKIAHDMGLALTGLAAIIVVLSLPNAVSAQAFDVLYNFGLDEANPQAPLRQGSDGYFYGMTYVGGSSSLGTIFKMDAGGHVTRLHSFAGSDGAHPPAGLIQANNGLFYGTTTQGGGGSCGGFGCGTVFSMDSAGTVTTLHSFTGGDGSGPVACLVQAADGNFYGTTSLGGTNSVGTAFRIDTSGNLTTLHNFGTSTNDGSQPTAGLIQGTDGNLYGTTDGGGPNLFGTVFKLDATGQVIILHAFAGADGAQPQGGLVQGRDGSFYGTTTGGGPNQWGTVFRMDAAGNLTTLHAFTTSDGIQPYAGLAQGVDGNFYGTTTSGGANGAGTIYRVDTSGNFSVLHSFAGTDGNLAASGVIQAADGTFYGTAESGGTNGTGVVFHLTIGTGCTPDAITLCLNNGRFMVQVSWTDFQGNTGVGNVVPGVTSTDSGLMWFFSADNWELLLKVLNGCGVNSNYWVFGAAATNVGYTIQVTDTQTGAIRTYTNPLGTTSPAITDTAAFPSCP